MKHLVLTLILTFMLVGMAAQEIIDGSPIRFSLLEAVDYDLNLTIGTSVGRLYTSVNFTVNKTELDSTDYYSFFLNENATLERVQINGVESRYNLTTNLHPKHFVPELTQADLIDASSGINCYSFDRELFSNLPDTINISLEYWLPLPAYSATLDGREAMELGNIPFFYPRNISASSEVNVLLITTIYHTMDTSYSTTDFGGVRKIRSKIVDIPTEDILFNIYKLN
jgi:hypothetical protein